MFGEGYMSKEDLQYFRDNFNIYKKNEHINFDNFTIICENFKGIDKTVLNETIQDLKKSLDNKNHHDHQIELKQDEYFNYVNTVLKDQAQIKNQNDPEMEKLFKSLAGKEGDYVYKKKLSDIITMFDLPVDLNMFFQPVNGQEELNFNEFCCLFKPKKINENFRKTFLTFIDKSSIEPDEKEDIKSIYQANFPIKFYGD